MAPSAVHPPQEELRVGALKQQPPLGHNGDKLSANEVLEAAKTRYIDRNPTSHELHNEAAESLPGGNTRSLLHNAPFPVFMQRGTGYQVVSEDGHVYTDFVGELTAGLYGHSNPVIHKTIKATLDNVGLSLGATTRLEARHAKAICERYSVERIRFANSGTEANLHAIQAARRFTGKRKVVVFTGGYHGAVLGFSGGKPEPNNIDLGDWLVAEYNDAEDAEAKIKHESDLAAVLIEGMQGSGPFISATHDFLHVVEDITKQVGAIFILDEVMTSRLAPGGIQALAGLHPDMTTFGKYLGGGLTFGAFGGREDIMAIYDPRNSGALAHSGTFNNNTLGMAAGHAGFTEVYTPEICIAFNKQGDDWRERLASISHGTKLTVTGNGSLLGIHFLIDGRKELASIADRKHDELLKELFWFEMMEDGFWITRRGSIALILGTPQAELDRFVSCVEGFLRRHETLVRI